VLNEYSSGLLNTRYETYNKKNGIETQEFDYQGLKQFTITKDTVMNWMPFLKWSIPITYVFGLVYFLIAILITASLFALKD
jgi:hypothetical protein